MNSQKKGRSARPPPPKSQPPAALSEDVDGVDEFLKALSEEDGPGLEPLDRGVEHDAAVLQSVELKQLTERWKQGIPGLSGDGQEEWRAGLNEGTVAAHAAAIAALMRNALLRSVASSEDARGTIKDVLSIPYFEVFPHPNSLLIKESKLRPGQSVRYLAGDFAQQIASRCHVAPESGELSWRALVRCLSEHPCDALLPGVHVTRGGLRELQVRLR